MANYYSQCDCGAYSNTVPCYDCLKRELQKYNQRVKELETAINILEKQLEIAAREITSKDDALL